MKPTIKYSELEQLFIKSRSNGPDYRVGKDLMQRFNIPFDRDLYFCPDNKLWEILSKYVKVEYETIQSPP